MKCNELMEEYLNTERYEKLSTQMIFHLLHCKKCRDNVRAMTLATHFTDNKIMRKASKTNPLYIKTMQKIIATKQEVTMNKSKFAILILSLWGVVGSAMLAIFLVIPSSKIGIKFIQSFGSHFTLQFLFTVVFFLTSCTIIFIANNINLLVKTFKLASSKV